MYHLLVSYSGWPQTTSSIGASRVFEYTEEYLSNFYKPGGILDLAQISRIPALFASETNGSGEQLARIGYINHAIVSGRDVNLRYTFDTSIPPITNEQLESLADVLGIESFELSRTHWAIKDIDLFQVLYANQLSVNSSPKIFSTDDIHRVEQDLISVMMPFSSEFRSVYDAISQMAISLNMRCLRADDIWENEAVIQDIVSLICRSSIVICDCSGRNPNVFYEAGIAHTLGKDVILIAQSEGDVPFDLRHLRYLPYLNNKEGRMNMVAELSKRVTTLKGRT